MSKTQRLVSIREAECIGCTKCIQACPVDAIVGAAQLMHTVITDHCIGCDLCIPPCPVDCIDVIERPETRSREQQQQDAKLAKQRAQQRKIRLARIAQQKRQERRKRIAEFNASPEASEMIKRAMEKAAAARSGRTDAQRQQAALEKLQSKLASMQQALELAKANNEDTQELERRIQTWQQKIRDHQ